MNSFSFYKYFIKHISQIVYGEEIINIYIKTLKLILENVEPFEK